VTGKAFPLRDQILARMQRVDEPYDSTVMCRCGATATFKQDVSRIDAFLQEHAPHVQGDEPKTLTEADIVAAVRGLADMVEAPAGDFSTKATLAATSFRVAAANKGHAYAVEHVGPIIARLREQARAAGQGAVVEGPLFGIPESEARPPAVSADARKAAPAAAGVAAVSESDLAWIQSAADAAQQDAASSAAHRTLAGMATRLVHEVRRLRTDLKRKG
jgi:hypothetical protein